MLVFGYIYPKTLPVSVFLLWFPALFVRSDFEHYAKGMDGYLTSIDKNILSLDVNIKTVKTNVESLKKEVERNAKAQENDRDKTKKSIRPR